MSLTTDLQRLTREGVYTCCWCGGEFLRDTWAYYDDDHAIANDCTGFVCTTCWHETREFTAAMEASPAAQTDGEGSRGVPATPDSSRDQHVPSPAGGAS